MGKNFYQQSDSLRFCLQSRYFKKREEFPADNINYLENFHQIESKLNADVHPEVVTGAALHGDGLLNDHGPQHVSMVINMAGLLLGENVRNLSGYEVFILLLSIHFHDVGNISGRDGHETRIYEVMEELGALLPLDAAQKRYVCLIAMAHGGKIGNNKDTISYLPQEDFLGGKKIRPALIAAILRFADEIADDNTRAARFLSQSGQIPTQNLIYHRYSQCLQTPAIDGEKLILKYDLSREDAINPYLKPNRPDSLSSIPQVFLYDEIIARLKKCLGELVYCNRYAAQYIRVTSIRADINVYIQTALNPIFKDSILLSPRGYPDLNNQNISDLSANPPVALNGEEMKKNIETRLFEKNES